MNDIVTTDATDIAVPDAEPVRRQPTEPVSYATLETVFGTGDLSKLSNQQRVEYMMRTCETLGINPLTRPFRFLSLNGQTQMYATRDCADQLRASRRISLSVSDPKIEEGVLIVTAKARTPDGRDDQDFGAVPFPQDIKGEARANLIMKAVTKAKRRVTLSICGLGFMDEMEVETLAGVRTFDAEPYVTEERHKAMESLMEQTKANRDKFLQHFRVDAIDQMDERAYLAAMNMLHTKLARMKDPTETGK